MEMTSRYNLRKRRHEIEKVVDVFERLPDDLITSHILSRLNLRKALKCSLISRRWRSLLKQVITSKLIFTGPGDFQSLFWIKRESNIFVYSVNKVLDFPQHKPTIDEFVVRFDLGSYYSHYITKWLDFAFKKAVQQLELDLSPYYLSRKRPNYVFPGIEIFSDRLELESNHGTNLNSRCCTAGLHNLRDICFKYVNIDGEAIEYMLSNCHSLERLRVKASETLINLKVCGASLGLKHLAIVDCEKAESIELLMVTSLVSFKYCGPSTALCLGYVPSLSELCIGGDYCRDFLRQRGSNLECISQLKKLKLDMTCQVVEECVNYPRKFEKFLSLEQLEVKMKIYNGLFLLWPTILIKAAPALRRFAITLKHDQCKLIAAATNQRRYCRFDSIEVGTTPGLSHKVKSKIKRASKKQHECLKVVEIRHFVGNKSDLGLAKHLLRMPFRSLEQFVLITSRGMPIEHYKEAWSDGVGETYRERSRGRANRVRSWLPSSTQLVIR